MERRRFPRFRRLEPPRDSDKPVKCFPMCRFFVCTQRAMIFKGDHVECALVGDVCKGPDCQYASCRAHRLVLPEGICGFSLRRKKVKEELPTEEEVLRIKVKEKVLRKLGERSLY